MSLHLNHRAAARIISEQGRTVSATAEAVGIERTNLTRMLSGERQFPADKLRRLAEFLGVNPYELLGPEDPRAAVLELAVMFGVTPEELTAAAS